MPAVTASFVSTSPQQQVAEAAPSDPTSSTSVQSLQQQVAEAAPSDPTSSTSVQIDPTYDPSVLYTPVATRASSSHSFPVPSSASSHALTPALTPPFWFSEVPRYPQLLRARGVDGADESAQVSETAEDGAVAPRWNNRLLDFGTVPGTTCLQESQRVAPYSQDFSTESVQDLSAFNSACDRVFGSGFDCSGQTVWIQHLIKAEEEFSVGPSFSTTLARNPDLGAGARKTLVKKLFKDGAKYKIPRDIVYRALAYLDLILARSVNIVNWDIPDVYLVCVHMAELHYSQGLNEYSRQIERAYKRVLHAFCILSYKRASLSRKILSMFEWNLGGPTHLDWLLVYFANFNALTTKDANALDFEKKLDVPHNILSAAFWVLENVVQSLQVAELPYSIIAAGVFKAVTVDLVPNRELDACLEFTGYTDEQLYRVTQCIAGLECPVAYDRVWSKSAGVMLQAAYFFDVNGDVLSVVDGEVQFVPDDVEEVVAAEAEVVAAEVDVVAAEAEVVAAEAEVVAAEAEAEPVVRVKKERVRRSKRIAAKVPPRRSARIAAQI